MISLPEYIEKFFPLLEVDAETDKALVYRIQANDTMFLSEGTHRSSIVIMDKTIAVHEEMFMTGFNKHSGAVWERWAVQTTEYFSLKQERENVPLLRMYTVSKKKKKRNLRNSTPGSLHALINGLNPRKSYYKVMISTVVLLALNYRLAQRMNTELPMNLEEMKKSIVNHAYPVTRFFPTLQSERLTTSIFANSKPWLGTTDIKQYLRKTFGVATVRKDMIKSLSLLEEPKALEILHMFRHTVPVDWTVLLLRKEKPYTLLTSFINSGSMEYNYGGRSLLTEEHRKTVVWFFKMLNIHQKKRLYCTTEKDLTTYVIKDTLTLLQHIGKEKTKEEFKEFDLTTWNTLHDSASKLYNKLKHTPKPIPQEDIMTKLDGSVLEVKNQKYYIASPKTTMELLEWGNSLNNCIASYANAVLSGSTTVFALYDNKRALIANLEIQEGHLVQFVEKSNKPVNTDFVEAMWKLMDEKQITSQEHEDKRNLQPRIVADIGRLVVAARGRQRFD